MTLPELISKIFCPIPLKYQGQLSAIAAAYSVLQQLPGPSGIRKGDVLTANEVLKEDPIFGGSEILILGYDNLGKNVIGTSIIIGGPSFLYRGSWSQAQVQHEFYEKGFWTFKKNIGHDIGAYFREVNPRLQEQRYLTYAKNAIEALLMLRGELLNRAT